MNVKDFMLRFYIQWTKWSFITCGKCNKWVYFNPNHDLSLNLTKKFWCPSGTKHRVKNRGKVKVKTRFKLKKKHYYNYGLRKDSSLPQ